MGSIEVMDDVTHVLLSRALRRYSLQELEHRSLPIEYFEGDESLVKSSLN
jgi:hypothetical protein